MLSSLMRDLARVPLGDVATLRAIFTDLAMPVLPRWAPETAAGEET
jgi:hypothetical protein